MAKTKRRVRKRRKRSRRGGLSDALCNRDNLYPALKEDCIKAGKGKYAKNPQSTSSSGCSDDDNFVRPGAPGPLCKTLRSRQAKTRAETDQNKKNQMQDVVNSMCNKLAGEHCKKSCGKCSPAGPKKRVLPPPPPSKPALMGVVKAAQNAAPVKKKCRDLSVSECGSNSDCKTHRFKSKGKGRSKLTCVNKSKITGGKRHKRTKRRRKKRTKKKARKKRKHKSNKLKR